MRDRIATEPSRRAAPAYNAEEQEYAGAKHVQGENFSQRLRISDCAEQAEADRCRAGEAEHRRRVHGESSCVGGPASSSARVTAIVSVMVNSMRRISGFAND